MDNGRRSHRKSRKGCVQCKKRKIKCGEERPQCINCNRHKTQCQYISTSSALSDGSPSSASTPLQSGIFPDTKHDGHTDSPGSVSPWSPQFTMMEMELLHNFSTYTCLTLDRNPAIQTLWRVNVPQLAFSNDFIMNGILCISALHIASSRPSLKDQYVSLALQHHERGLAIVNSILPGASVTNCTALYIFSALTGIISFAKPKWPDDFLVLGQNGIADWLMLFRGTKHLIQMYQTELCASELGPMFHHGLRRRDVWLEGGGHAHDALDLLLRYLENMVRDEKTLAVYRSAVKELRQSFYLMAKTPAQELQCADIFLWFFEVHEDYLALLYNRSQEAMAVFAFYCVLLKEMEWSWFVRGWSTHIISVLYRNLDAEHRLWIQWPLEQMGWNPN